MTLESRASGHRAARHSGTGAAAPLRNSCTTPEPCQPSLCTQRPAPHTRPARAARLGSAHCDGAEATRHPPPLSRPRSHAPQHPRPAPPHSTLVTPAAASQLPAPAAEAGKGAAPPDEPAASSVETYPRKLTCALFGAFACTLPSVARTTLMDPQLRLSCFEPRRLETVLRDCRA